MLNIPRFHIIWCHFVIWCRNQLFYQSDYSSSSSVTQLVHWYVLVWLCNVRCVSLIFSSFHVLNRVCTPFLILVSVNSSLNLVLRTSDCCFWHNWTTYPGEQRRLPWRIPTSNPAIRFIAVLRRVPGLVDSSYTTVLRRVSPRYIYCLTWQSPAGRYYLFTISGVFVYSS